MLSIGALRFGRVSAEVSDTVSTTTESISPVGVACAVALGGLIVYMGCLQSQPDRKLPAGMAPPPPPKSSLPAKQQQVQKTATAEPALPCKVLVQY